MGSKEYHLQELVIARTASDPRRMMPTVEPRHRAILDVGCGAGQTLIACELDSDVTAVGVDVDPDALRLGRELDDRLQLACAKGEGLPFRSGYFDLVISRVTLPLMHIDRALAEMSRVLRPAGDLWISVHPLSMTVAALREALLGFKIRSVLFRLYVLANGVALHVLGRQFSMPFRKGRYESFQTDRSIVRALKRAGFADIEIDKSKCFVVAAKKKGVPGTPAISAQQAIVK